MGTSFRRVDRGRRDRASRRPDKGRAHIENETAEPVGIEVKAAATVNASDFKGLRKLGEQTVPFGDRMFTAPVSCLWG